MNHKGRKFLSLMLAGILIAAAPSEAYAAEGEVVEDGMQDEMEDGMDDGMDDEDEMDDEEAEGPFNISEVAEVGSIESEIYTGEEIEPEIILVHDDYELTEEEDYLVEYANNVEVGQASVMIVGTGDYEGIIEGITFEILPMDIKEVDAEVDEEEDLYYTGMEVEPDIIVTNDDNELEEGIDYEISYSNNIKVGTAAYTITGMGNYKGVLTGTYEIMSVPIEDVDIEDIETQNYTGTKRVPILSMIYEDEVLEKNRDYTVTVKNNLNIGTATMTITGKGNYSGKVTMKFKIAATKGKVVTVGTIKYKFLNATTVEFAGLKKNNSGTLKLPDTVKIGGKKFNVVSIGKAACKGRSITGAVVGNKVKTLGADAFCNCKNLKKITIGKAVTKIDTKAFWGCGKLSDITIKAMKLTTVGKNAFKGIKGNARIKVPAKQLKQYEKLMKKKGQSNQVQIVTG